MHSENSQEIVAAQVESLIHGHGYANRCLAKSTPEPH